MLAAVAVLALVGCGGSPASTDPTSATDPDPGSTSAATPTSAVSSTSAASPTATTAGDELTFVSWGGAFQEAQTKAYLDAFEAETGVTINQDGPIEYDEIVSMVDAGDVSWDVVDVVGDFALGESSQYFEPIDYSVVPRDQIVDGLADEYRVGVSQYATVLGYNTDTYDQAPTGWADFFDVEAFPGTRALPSRAGAFAFEVALLADGVEPDDLYPLDVDRAVDVLDRISDDVIFWDTGAESTEQVAAGDADLSMIWNGRIQTAIDDEAPLAIQWNGHLVQADYLAVPKGVPDPGLAMELVAFMTSAEHNARISDFIAYAPTNVDSFDQVDPQRAGVLPTYGDRLEQGVRPDDAWWDANREATTAAYEDWMASAQ